MRRTVHDIWCGDFHSETHRGEARCDHNNPEDFNWREREDRDAARIFECKTDEKRTRLCDVLSQQMENELLSDGNPGRAPS